MSENLQFNKTISRLEPIIRYSGLNVICGEKKPSGVKKRLCLLILNYFCVNYSIFSGTLYFIDGISKGQDFFDLTFIAPCIILGIMAVSKSAALIYHKKEVEHLMENLRQLGREENNRIHFVEKENIIATDLKYLIIIINTLNILYGLLVITFTFTPLLLTALRYHQTNEFELFLSFTLLYPLDVQNIKHYPILFLHQSWTDLIVVLHIASADYFFFICCTYIRIQFRLLQYDFERIIENRKISAGPFHRDAGFKTKFTDLVIRHQKLIESANLLETIFSYSTLVNFITSSVIICLSGFNVKMMDDMTEIVQFLCFLFMSLMQIFFLCLFADLLSSSSIEFSNAIYNCNWYLADTSVRKQLLIILTRAQNPCKLTAAGFADVNLNSFLRVMSTSWSYFALIQTMYSSET